MMGGNIGRCAAVMGGNIGRCAAVMGGILVGVLL